MASLGYMWAKNYRVMRGYFCRFFTIFVATILSSCALLSRGDVTIEGIASVESVRLADEGEALRVEAILRNDSSEEVVVERGWIVAKMKREPLISFTLDEAVRIPPQGRVVVDSRWRIYRDDPPTLYAMRRHPLERYMDRLTFDFKIQVRGVGRGVKTLSKRGVKGSDIEMDLKGILR